MTGILVLLMLLVVLVTLATVLAKVMWQWRPPIGRRLVQGAAVLGIGFTLYAYGSLTGAWFHVSPEGAEVELEAVLGFDLPPVYRVLNARDLGWAPTDGPHYGYTVAFDSTGFAAFMEEWSSLSDSLSWVRYDTSEHITHEFDVEPQLRQVRYFHADE